MNRTELVIEEIKESMKKKGRAFEKGYINIIDFLDEIKDCEIEDNLVERIENYKGHIKCDEYYELEYNNTYNYENTFSNDFNWQVFRFDDREILGIKVHIGYDIRYGYTNTIYYNFEDVIRTIAEYCDDIENLTFLYILNNYIKTISVTDYMYIEYSAINNGGKLYKTLTKYSDYKEDFWNYEDAVRYCEDYL